MKRVVSILMLLLLLATTGCAVNNGAETPVSPPDLKNATYAVLVGTIGEKYVEEHIPEAVKIPLDSISHALMAQLSGKADYIVSEYTNCLNIVRANSGKLAILPDGLTSEGCAVAVNKSETELLEEIDRMLTQFRTDGILDCIIKKKNTRGRLGLCTRGYSGA